MPDAPKPRRRGGANSETRTQLIDAAERLLLEEGYAAVTTRRLATRANLKSQLVHYYFESIDEVFVAVIRRRATRNLQRAIEAIDLDRPLEALWLIGGDRESVSFWQELLALANHRKAIREEVRHYMEQRRQLQAAALERGFKATGTASEVPLIVWALLVGGVSYMVSTEGMLGLSEGHKETLELVREIVARGVGISEGLVDPLA
jgi:AcrR family transcriptional regulator